MNSWHVYAVVLAALAGTLMAATLHADIPSCGAEARSIGYHLMCR